MTGGPMQQAVEAAAKAGWDAHAAKPWVTTSAANRTASKRQARTMLLAALPFLMTPTEAAKEASGYWRNTSPTQATDQDIARSVLNAQRDALTQEAP